MTNPDAEIVPPDPSTDPGPQPGTIEAVRTYRCSLPLSRPQSTSIHHIASLENMLVEVDSDGMTGVGYAYFFSPGEVAVTRGMVSELASSLIGTAPGVRSAWQQMWSRLNWTGQSGLGVIALSTIDTALWDLHAQRAGMPLYRLLGGTDSALPVYATGGWTSQPVGEVIDLGNMYREAGFQHYKIKVGSPDWRTDVKRLEQVMSALGDSMKILIDANQRWSVHEAIQAGHAFSDCGIHWFEEPVAADDVEGQACVTRSVRAPIAIGETVFSVPGFKPLVESRAGDIMMPDLMRCGGPTGFLRVGELVGAHNMPVSSHTFPEASAHVMSALPNATLVETIPGWWDAMFDQVPEINDGHIHLSDVPGLGMTFRPEAKVDR